MGVNIEKYIIEFTDRLAKIEEKVSQIDLAVGNHLRHDHKKAEIISWIQCAIIIGLFCFLKWGR